MKFTAIAAASFLFFGVSSLAADQTPPITDWSNIETVVVTAQAPGPAFWRLSKGDSEIWILGTLGPMPEKLAWNTNHLAQLIDGAHEVLLPPKASAGFFDLAWFLLTNRELLSMPDGQKLEDSLSPQLRARFIAAREAIHRKPGHYEDDSPVVAAVKLESETNDAMNLSWDEPRETVEKIARVKHVKVREIANYDATQLVKEILKLGPEAGRACLENAVGDVELRTAHAVPAADAWAVGDLKDIKAHYAAPTLGPCVRSSGSYSKLDQRAVADSLAAIDAALSKPGKTVMLVDIGSLLRNTGVIEKLREKGIAIEGPAE